MQIELIPEESKTEKNTDTPDHSQPLFKTGLKF
jgi:hypothetical protein